jgi:hypothetical protein
LIAVVLRDLRLGAEDWSSRLCHDGRSVLRGLSMPLLPVGRVVLPHREDHIVVDAAGYV